jgi:hypothetical protein
MSVAPASLAPAAAAAADVLGADDSASATDAGSKLDDSSSRPSDLPPVSLRSRLELPTAESGERRTLSPFAPLADVDGDMLMLKADVEAPALAAEEDMSPSSVRFARVPSRFKLLNPGIVSSSVSTLTFPSLLSYADSSVMRAIYASC